MHLQSVVARGLGVGLAVGLLGLGIQGLASAAVPAKAVISAPEVVAGSSGTLTIEVSNPASGSITAKNAAINVVRVMPPISSSGSLTATLPSAADVPGWSKTRTPDGKGFRFAATASSSPTAGTPAGTTSGIADGGKQAFTFSATYLAQSADTIGFWRVMTSTDGGSSYAEANGADSVLSQTVRAVAIDSAVLELKRSGFVTASQNNAKLTVTVNNTAAQPATVTVSASNSSGDGMAPLTVTVPARSSVPVTGYPTFGSAASASRSLVVTAVGSTSGDGGGSVSNSTTTSPYVVQAPMTFTCTGLTPTVVGESALVRPKANITGSGIEGGVESATLAASSSYLDFGSAVVGGTLRLGADLSAAAGVTSTYVPFVDGRSAPASSDFTAPVTFKAVGADANGAVIDHTVSCGSLDIDVTAATATIAVSTPQKAPTRMGEAPGATTGGYVAKNNDTVTFSGTVTSGGAPDSAAVYCTLLEYEDGAFVAQVDNIACTNTGGTFSAKYSQYYNPRANSATLAVDVTDAAGNTSRAYSPSFLVDTDPPVFDELTSATVTGTTIVLGLSELVAISHQPGDFGVTNGGLPVLVESVATDGGDGKFSTSITLTLRTPIGEDATPTVTYAPAPNSAKADGAGNPLSGTIVVSDGIAPGAPGVMDVDDRTLVNGSYYTNNPRPIFRITDVADQHQVSVYRDANANGHLDDGEAVLCETTNTDDISEVLCVTDATQVEGDQSLIVVSRDPSGNVTVQPTQARLVVDFTGPQIVGLEHTADGVIVVLNEPLVGNSTPDDWFVARPDGESAVPASMSIDETRTRLTLGFGSVDAPIQQAATAVTYQVTGGTRYSDLAGNTMEDQTFSV